MVLVFLLQPAATTAQAQHPGPQRFTTPWVADQLVPVTDSDAERSDVLRRSASPRLIGAGVGFVVGAGVTYFVLHQGGSTSPCDRSANQDAMSAGECVGLAALGGLAGAGLGAIAGGFFRTERLPHPLHRLRLSLMRGGTARAVFSLPR